MASTWIYSCKLGLYQGTCGEYQKDDTARGANQRWAGCPSCIHRVAADAPTREADRHYAVFKSRTE